MSKQHSRSTLQAHATIKMAFSSHQSGSRTRTPPPIFRPLNKLLCSTSLLHLGIKYYLSSLVFLLYLTSVPYSTASSLADTSFINRNSPAAFELPSQNSQRSDPQFSVVGMEKLDEYPNKVKCVYYNQTECQMFGTGCGNTYHVCHQTESSTSAPLCYALWRNVTNETHSEHEIQFKGCWIGRSPDCISNGSSLQRTCVQTRPPNKNPHAFFFCCCTSNFCNENVKFMPILASSVSEPPSDVLEDDALGNSNRVSFVTYILLGLAMCFLVCVVSGTVYFFGKWRHKPGSGDIPTHEPLLENSQNCSITGYVGSNPIQLKEIRAHGKFGSVWRATDGHDKMVAVKVFSLQDRNSWQIEKDVFSLPQMKHANILSYLGAERRGEGLNMEFWIITEYHQYGSLYDYLKSHTVNWKQLLTIIQGIGKGLTHLHEEFPAVLGQGAKPSIAHRDFKSKNVLLNENFRACIADFGLALVFHPNTTCGDAHGQVGTRRYMAPEVLEGAINFNRDSFLRIDMYACGLVLWELMSRCCFGDITCGEYRLPFEDEVGANPSLEDMQEVVAQQKKRPELSDAWLKQPGMSVVANTVQDCWDQDAEARISASTICERIQSLITNEDNCLSPSNVNNYRAAFNATNSMVSNGGVNSKNSFLMASHAATGPKALLTSTSTAPTNGVTPLLRETSA